MIQNKNDSQPLLEIFLLGKFQVKIDGTAVDEKSWSRRSAKSLVKLLALKPFHAFHREQIMDLLWAEEMPETAVNNLNKAIHGARRALEPELAKGSHSRFILTQNNQISLDSPGSLVVDLDEFERLANIAINKNDLDSARKAIEIYRGDLLTEDIYEDWIYTRRESMRILFRKTATKTAEIYASRSEHSKSIEILQKLIASDATDEYVHRLLMRFYAETGSKYQALKQFEHCRAALQTLGIEPEAETVKLEQGIRRGEILPKKKEFKSAPAPLLPRITQLTFQNRCIKSARFLPDDETIIFSSHWNRADAELYTLNLQNGEMQNTGIRNALILSVSSKEEIVVALNTVFYAFVPVGKLATMTLTGENPRELLEDVQWADWYSSKNVNSSLPFEQFPAVVRERNGKNCLEFPVGSVIYETEGWLSHPKFSPDGKKIVFIEHLLSGDDRGFVVCLDLENGTNKERKTVLTSVSLSILGLAWLNDEIWFTAAREGNARSLQAVNLQGESRLIYRGTGRFTLLDIAKDGKALVTEDKMRPHIVVRHESDISERDLTWHDWTLHRDFTDDGKTLLFEEAGISGGNQFSTYIRNIDGSGTKKLADCSSIVFSPDGKNVLGRFQDPHSHYSLISLDDGTITPLETNTSKTLVHQVFASFFPDGKRIMFSANELNRGRQIFIQNLDGGSPVLFTPDEGLEMLSSRSISPDGEYVILTDFEIKLFLYRTTDGKSSPLKNLEKGFSLIRWSDDGEHIFIWRRGEIPAVVYKYNPANGTKKKWLELTPKDTNGICQLVGIKLTPDGKTYAYSIVNELSELYLMEDLK